MFRPSQFSTSRNSFAASNCAKSVTDFRARNQFHHSNSEQSQVSKTVLTKIYISTRNLISLSTDIDSIVRHSSVLQVQVSSPNFVRKAQFMALHTLPITSVTGSNGKCLVFVWSLQINSIQINWANFSIWWVIAIVLSVVLCINSIHNVWLKWNSVPIIITLNNKPMPIGDIPFPAITVCPVTKTAANKLNYTDVYRAMLKLDGNKSRTVTEKEYNN